MDTKKIGKSILIIILFLFIIAGVGITVYFVTKKPEVIQNIISPNKNTNKDDIKNGIYSYEEKLSKSYRIFNGCNITSLYKYVVIINDEYRYYDSSCMKTALLKTGNINELKFTQNSQNGNYEFEFDNKKFKKNKTVNRIVEENNLQNKISNTSIDTINFLIERTELPGSYYSFETKISGANTSFLYKFTYNKDANNFTISLNSATGSVLFSRTYNELTNLPIFVPINYQLAIIERTMQNNKYNYNLLLYSSLEEKYNLIKEFPIKVNNTELNANNNIYITTKNSDEFTILFGNNSNFCTENNENGIAYYEFNIKYDYKTSNFATPEFVKVVRNSEGCKEIKNKYLKEE